MDHRNNHLTLVARSVAVVALSGCHAGPGGDATAADTTAGTEAATEATVGTTQVDPDTTDDRGEEATGGTRADDDSGSGDGSGSDAGSDSGSDASSDAGSDGGSDSGGVDPCDPSQVDACVTEVDEDCDGVPAACSGTLLGGWKIGGYASDAMSAFSVTPDGGLIVGGMSDSWDNDFGDGVVISNYDDAAYVARYGEGFDVSWATSIGDGGFEDVVANIVGVAAVGDATAIVGSHGQTEPLVLLGEVPPGAFVGLLDASGAPVWMAHIESQHCAAAQLVKLEDDSLLVAGCSWGLPGFDGPAVVDLDDPRIWLARFDVDGSLRFGRVLGSALPGRAPQLVALPSGGYGVAAWFDGSVDVDGEDLPAPPGYGGYVLRIDAEDDLVHAATFESSPFARVQLVGHADDLLVGSGEPIDYGAVSSDAPWSIARFDPAGRLDLTELDEAGTTFAVDAAGAIVLLVPGVDQMSVNKYDADGNALWSATVQGEGAGPRILEPAAVGIDPLLRIWVAGRFYPRVTIDGTTIESTSLAADHFVAVFDQ